MTRYSLLLIGGMALGLGACTGKGEAPVEAESTEAVNQGLASPEAGEAAKKPDEAPTPKKATVKVLPLGEGAVAIQPREDLTETAKKRTPWDNYALEDSLSLKYINEGKSAPFPGSQGYGAYKRPGRVHASKRHHGLQRWGTCTETACWRERRKRQ